MQRGFKGFYHSTNRIWFLMNKAKQIFWWSCFSQMNKFSFINYIWRISNVDKNKDHQGMSGWSSDEYWLFFPLGFSISRWLIRLDFRLGKVRKGVTCCLLLLGLSKTICKRSSKFFLSTPLVTFSFFYNMIQPRCSFFLWLCGSKD